MQSSLLYKQNLPALTGGFKEFSPGPADSTCLPEAKTLENQRDMSGGSLKNGSQAANERFFDFPEMRLIA